MDLSVKVVVECKSQVGTEIYLPAIVNFEICHYRERNLLGVIYGAYFPGPVAAHAVSVHHDFHSIVFDCGACLHSFLLKPQTDRYAPSPRRGEPFGYRSAYLQVKVWIISVDMAYLGRKGYGRRTADIDCRIDFIFKSKV